MGTFGWGGAASTVFWVDPANRRYVVMMTQVLPDGGDSKFTMPLLRALKRDWT